MPRGLVLAASIAGDDDSALVTQAYTPSGTSNVGTTAAPNSFAATSGLEVLL